jgi:hypothetical protein
LALRSFVGEERDREKEKERERERDALTLPALSLLFHRPPPLKFITPKHASYH